MTTPKTESTPVDAPAPVDVPAPAPAPVLVLERLPHRARTAGEQGENLGKIVLYHQVESPQNPAVVTPAIIQAVRDDDPALVRLFVFGHGGVELVDDVPHGFAVGEWSLPGEAPPPPVVTVLDPATVEIGALSFTLHVRGTGFAPGAVITFAGHDEPTTVVSDSEVTTGVDMTLWVGPDAVPVTVRNADAQVSAPLLFTFTEPAVAGTSRRAKAPEPEPEPPNHARRR